MPLFQELIINLLGKENAILDQESLREKTQNTLNSKTRILGILYPKNKNDILEIVKLANEYKIKLYPVSTGKNWGYGCQTPTTENCYIINLSNLNQIKVIDKNLGVFNVEPGVTQDIMQKFLLDNKLEYIIPTTGAGLNCSLIGNALERGYGLSPITNHFNAITSIEAILANGEIYQSPFCAYNCDLLNHLHKNGIGANIESLFAQSNFGIVTNASIMLQKKSDQVDCFYFGINDINGINKWIEPVQKIMSEFNEIVYSMTIMNKNRILATINQNTTATDNFDSDTIYKIVNTSEKTEWLLAGSIHGRKEINQCVIKELKKLFSQNSDKMMFFSQKKINRLRKVLSYIPIIKKSKGTFYLIDQMEFYIKIVSGISSNLGLNLAYLHQHYKKENLPILNPSLDNVGLRWFAPLVPIIPEKVSQFIEIVTRISFAHHVPPRITLNTISKLCFDCTIPIYFEKHNTKSEEAANLYFWDLLKTCQAAGFFPYRLDIDAQKQLINREVSHWKTAISIKKALDPNNILSPGRYLPDDLA